MADNWLFVEALALCGADLFAVDDKKWTALHYAADKNHYRSLQVLSRLGMKERDIQTLGDDVHSLVVAEKNEESSLILSGEAFMGNTIFKRLFELTTEKDEVLVQDYKKITDFDFMDREYVPEESKIHESMDLSGSWPSSPVISPADDRANLNSSDPSLKTMWIRGTESVKDEPKRSTLARFRQRKKGKTMSLKRSRILRHRDRGETIATPIHAISVVPAISTPRGERSRSRSYGEQYFTKVANEMELKVPVKVEKQSGKSETQISESDGEPCPFFSDNESDSSYDETGFSEESDEEEVFISVPQKPSYPEVVSIPGFEFPSS
eukprot:CAMPEP_0117007440 /NCGR_PEP_ID=MMETSP0472-20121206/7320_1 /TAXON_ID=693140 ORGANISM="Tiarina fusus, Strain LIS" /NCGR_SAMPLE_ID=MMETSP0472 /ASSEMBLY_ACC=CAM_ASM_000603 /LENGTH=322 /DNA_ID=CAMNT_0004709211 /DNA_START=266 /DNA_END=1231 /DNA_ORIENTATION=+